MLTYTTRCIIKYAQDKYNIALNTWQIYTLEKIMSTSSNICVITSNRGVGKTILIEILASFYSTFAHNDVGIVYLSRDLQRTSKRNPAYSEMKNILRFNIKEYNDSLRFNIIDTLLFDEISQYKLLNIQTNKSIVMYTP